jgi:HAD superfamily hydrolase (TIGR01509 family)
MPDLTIFLDDGGVMNDNRLRGAQWQRRVAEFFAPRFGGQPGAWAEANRVVAHSLFANGAWEVRLATVLDYESFERRYYLDWLQGMFSIMRIDMPPDEEAIRLAKEAGVWITSGVKADFPGAADTIRLLRERGYTLNTSSATVSAELAGYLDAMGVRECFTHLYGPDLVSAMKSSPRYYERIFEDAGVRPQDALVLDDNPRAIVWASEAGASTLLIGAGEIPRVPGCLGGIRSLAELPGRIGLRKT